MDNVDTGSPFTPYHYLLAACHVLKLEVLKEMFHSNVPIRTGSYLIQSEPPEEPL